MIAVADDGTVYVTRRDVGDVVMLRDADGDGRADVQQTVASRPMMHGIAIDGDTVYLVTVNDVYRAEIDADGRLRAAASGSSTTCRTAASTRTARSRSGPTACSTSRSARPATPATRPTPRAPPSCAPSPTAQPRTIFAAGLRNTIGFGWRPGDAASSGAWTMASTGSATTSSPRS